MKKKERITINGETFTVCGTVDSMAFVNGVDEHEIYNVYGRPSEIKVSIWRDWCKWARECDADISICGHSSNFFSIIGNVEHNGKVYQLHITYANNRLYEVI